jgi:hypothetical protein
MLRVLLAATVAALLAAGPSFASDPVATAAGKCSVKGKQRKLGATYVTSVRATGVSCRSALSLVKDYHACRRDRGGADGRCPRVNGWRCSENRTTSPTQYDSTATCRKGDRRVKQDYTQNT